MKKLLCLLLFAVIILAITACGEEGLLVDNGNDISQETEIKHTGKKISGEIVAASTFSEGLAFVETSEEPDKTYCIDKNGNIVFELDIDLSVNGDISTNFVNGLAYVNDGFCDITGKLTKPADVGATSFYYISTLKAGYILAEVVTSDYSATNKKLGVLNTKFEWSVDPSEKLYNEFADENGYSQISTALNTSDFADGDIYYNVDLGKSLNLKTGEVIKGMGDLKSLKSSSWVLAANSTQYTGYYLPDSDTDFSAEGLMLDLTKKGIVCSATDFINGRAAIIYHNKDANKYYVTMINEDGNHLFEPVETKYNNVQTDGKYILVSDTQMGTADYAEIFNDKGEKTGEKDVSSDTSLSYHFYLKDGIILVQAGKISMMSGYSGKAFYLDANCNDLF